MKGNFFVGEAFEVLMRTRFLKRGVLLGVLAATFPAFAQVQILGAKFEPEGNKVYHGAAVPDYWNESGLKSQISNYATAAGKKTAVVTWFASAYENGRMTSWRQNYATNLTRVRRIGAASLIKFSTQDANFHSTRKMAELPDIGRGVWDAYFTEAALVLKEFKGPVFFSMNHEMNGNWYPYSQAYPGSKTTASDFVRAWQRVVNIFRQNGANNVAFVWSPNVPDVGGVSFAQYYPGDAYVDWVGVSLYSGNDPTAMDTIYRAYAAKKPFFITEWATAPEQSKYNPRFPGEVEWVRQFFTTLDRRYPRVKAISWFNWNNRDGDYRLSRVPAQAQAYKQDVANSRYIDSSTLLLDDTADLKRPTIVRPGNEIVLQQVPRVENPQAQRAPVQNAPAQTPPVQRSLLERVRIQITPRK